MDLFHVSCKPYKKGTFISSEEFEHTEYYNNSIKKGQNWIDEYLDSIRPDGTPERKKTLFTFDSLGNCFVFKKGQCPDGLNYYKVKMVNPIGCPMCLTDKLKKDSEEYNKRIGAEYWSPKKKWKFLEYLSDEMQIIEIMAEPDSMEKIKGQCNYLYDFEQKNKI
ncbi:MAG: hypothetical protein JEY97_02240 [Bacteroidales bacterium]|nr:hypothetical protein [Bacteroidales bacterium]